MLINADKPRLWKEDVAKSIDLFNNWFLDFAPITYQQERIKATQEVKDALLKADDLLSLTPQILQQHPGILPILRMCTAPPLARDRLIGLSQVGKSLVQTMERGSRPTRMLAPALELQLQRISDTLVKLVDDDVFPWLAEGRRPTEIERTRASTIVADRRCGAAADPIVRNAQEQRQLALVEQFLLERGYRRKQHPGNQPITEMEAGTFAFRLNLIVGNELKVNIPVDVVIQPKVLRANRLPVLIEAKSAGDFTNTNKRRKEEATKMRQLQATYGSEIQFVLLLCGYFGPQYLGYEASEGLDWVWEHRLNDLLYLGLE